jgi:hypothetical protein
MRAPDVPGTYVIYRVGLASVCDAIVDVGETGQRPRSNIQGLRGRLATSVAHSASEKIASDIRSGKLSDDLRVVWIEQESKAEAKELQDALISLFRQECGRQPGYNTKRESHPSPEQFESVYDTLKVHIGCG